MILSGLLRSPLRPRPPARRSGLHRDLPAVLDGRDRADVGSASGIASSLRTTSRWGPGQVADRAPWRRLSALGDSPSRADGPAQKVWILGGRCSACFPTTQTTCSTGHRRPEGGGWIVSGLDELSCHTLGHVPYRWARHDDPTRSEGARAPTRARSDRRHRAPLSLLPVVLRAHSSTGPMAAGKRCCPFRRRRSAACRPRLPVRGPAAPGRRRCGDVRAVVWPEAGSLDDPGVHRGLCRRARRAAGADSLCAGCERHHRGDDHEGDCSQSHAPSPEGPGGSRAPGADASSPVPAH